MLQNRCQKIKSATGLRPHEPGQLLAQSLGFVYSVFPMTRAWLARRRAAPHGRAAFRASFGGGRRFVFFEPLPNNNSLVAFHGSHSFCTDMYRQTQQGQNEYNVCVCLYLSITEWFMNECGIYIYTHDYIFYIVNSPLDSRTQMGVSNAGSIRKHHTGRALRSKSLLGRAPQPVGARNRCLACAKMNTKKYICKNIVCNAVLWISTATSCWAFLSQSWQRKTW